MPISSNPYQSIEKYQSISDHEKWDKANQKLAIKSNDGIIIDVVRRSSTRSWCSVVFYIILFPLGLARLAIAGYSAPRSRESNKKLIEKFIDDVKKTPSTETREKVLEELNEKLQKKKAISPSEARGYGSRIVNDKSQLSISESKIEERNENKKMAERFTEMAKKKLDCARKLKNFLEETNNKIGPLPKSVPTEKNQTMPDNKQQKKKLADETSLGKMILAKDLAIEKMKKKSKKLKGKELDDYLKVENIHSDEKKIYSINEIPVDIVRFYDFVNPELKETKNFDEIKETIRACFNKLKETEIHSNMMTIAKAEAPEKLIQESPFFKDHEDFLAYYKEYTSLIQNLTKEFRTIVQVLKAYNEMNTINAKQFPPIGRSKAFDKLFASERMIYCLYGRGWVKNEQ